MKNRTIIAVLGLSLALSSCAGTGANQSEINTNKGNLANLPDWVLNPEIEGGVAAVGIAAPSVGGIRFQIAKAEMDARANIANTIGSEISRITKNSLREANVSGVNDVEDFFAQATKEVVRDLPLSGVKRINIFEAPDKTLYVHMLLTQKDFSQYIASSQRNLEAKLNRANLSRENINRSQEASKELFDELERSLVKTN